MKPLVRGDDKDIVITVVDSAGQIKDLTGVVVSADFTLSRKTGLPAVFTKTLGSGIAVTDAANGLVTVSLNTDDTDRLGTFAFRLRVTDGSDNDTTVVRGYLTIEAA